LELTAGRGFPLKADGVAVSPSDDADEHQLHEGTRVRLIAPEQAKTASIAGTSTGTLHLKVAEKKAILSRVARTGGKVRLITVVAQDLSPALVGGVVVTEAGQTVGLVQSTTPSEAKVLPVAVIRSAAVRVLARTPVAPGPWLGVRGEALTSATFARLESLGWPKEVADNLIKQQRGILLTTVVPGTPAQLGELKPGDVLVNVNDGDIVTNEDLSSILNNIDRDRPVRLKLLRPNVFAPINVTVKLGRSIDPVTATVIAERRALAVRHGGRLSRFGVETFMISERTASRLGSRGGLLVLSVQPGSAGDRAGLRSEDVIESIDGSPAAGFDHTLLPRSTPAIKISLIRDARRLEVLLQPDPQEP
jgi:S1-C subfamily serine protease